MAATNPVVLLAALVKLEAPDGDVRLCDGGILDYASERYESWHAVFGSIHQTDELEAAFGDAAEYGQLVLAPNPEADGADWWRVDLEGCRLRGWIGELDADEVTVSSATQVHDLFVDAGERIQGEGGEDLLVLELVGRGDKLFLANEGNVCSDTFHQTVFSGETGFANCTDVRGFVAWGAESPARSAGGQTSIPGGFRGGDNRLRFGEERL